MSYEQISSSVWLSEDLPASDKALITDRMAAHSHDWEAEAQKLDAEAQKPDAEAQKISIKALVDGRGLACPMPLLKTKVALRGINQGESVFVLATDPNSCADIRAFCEQSQQADSTDALALVASFSSGTPDTPDTIFHFIITKTSSN